MNSDFVNVQLTAAGIAAAGGALRITAHHMSYEFKPGVPVRVLTSEWARVLSSETLRGLNLFELAPVIDASSVTKAQSKTAKTAEAATQTETAEEGK